MVFVHGYKKGLQVNHKDGNKKNNAAYNLEWVTTQQNIKHSVENGLNARGQRHGMSKITEYQAKKIIEYDKSKRFSRKELSEIYGIDISNVGMIVNGNHWQKTITRFVSQ
jgi:hypothetical protein